MDRTPYEIFRDVPCHQDGPFAAMNLRKFMAYIDAGNVCSPNLEADDSMIEFANDAVAAGIVFG